MKPTKNHILSLILQYMEGWKQNDITLITSCLTLDCTIIESHGPVYHGHYALEQWFELWLEANSVVKRWDMTSFYFCPSASAAFAEWDFFCISHHTDYSFQGISIYKFHHQKISFIHEYRMTHPATIWEGKKLRSE